MSASFTVFVCSTFDDLEQEREAVLDAIKRVQQRHNAMEFFGARPGRPIDVCLEEVRKSDLLVVIVGLKYGSLPHGTGISYSQAEYEEGVRLNKPCLVYLRDDDIPILPKFVERDPDKLRLLEAWKQTLNANHTVAKFEDWPRLAVQVAADIGRTILDFENVSRERAIARTSAGETWIAEVHGVVSDALGQGVPEAQLLLALRSAVTSLLATSQRQPSVFLSYSRADAQIVSQIAIGLAAASIRVWMDTLLKPGAKWMNEIERGLSTADFVAFFISPHSVTSGWAATEINVALHRQISGEGGAAILPVLLQDADVPPLLRQYTWVDLRDGDI